MVPVAETGEGGMVFFAQKKWRAICACSSRSRPPVPAPSARRRVAAVAHAHCPCPPASCPCACQDGGWRGAAVTGKPDVRGCPHHAWPARGARHGRRSQCAAGMAV